jgi:large subunit ribosomal protein L23
MSSLKLSREAAYSILLSPVITEKATRVTEFNQVTFKVRSEASKPQIKAAVEQVFGVKVVAVNTVLTKGKKKFFRGRPGQRSDVKKAVVTLAEGQTIDLTTGV